MSGLSLQSAASSGSSSSSLVSGSQTGKVGGAFRIVKEGLARVKEEGNFMKGMFWSDKWLVLREFTLDFHKNSASPKPSFTIQLRDIISISRSDQYPYSFEIIRSLASSSGASPPRDGPSKIYVCKVETDDEVYSWIDCIYQRCPSMGGVSNPTNFTHRVHVGFDPNTGHFVGLPPEWEKLLTASAITKDDYAKNPKAVLEVLEFYTEKLVKRSEDPVAYPSLTPTPALESGSNKQLGYGGTGNSIAPPRSGPPNGFLRKDSYHTVKSEQSSSMQYSSPYEKTPQQQAYAETLAAEERRRRRDQDARVQREQQREREKREHEELTAYNASIPRNRTPLADQEPSGPGDDGRDLGSSAAPTRYNPTRPAPSTPSAAKDQQQSPASLRQITAQRQAPSAPTAANGVDAYQKLAQSKQPQQHPAQPSKTSTASTKQSPSRSQPNGVNGAAQAQSRGPAVATPKPLNVAIKQVVSLAGTSDAVKKAEQALTKKDEGDGRKKDVRMSSMTESEVMAKLREVVSKDRPLDSYNKQKKIGQGASGSVYVARIRENAPSAVARSIVRENGPRAQVAIKQMDLRNQPRKELIVNEIIVMKDSKHPNIVNFLDAFLQEEQSELWVVMEFMEGGALTDVIDNNPSISEDQIATICLEVGQRVSLACEQASLT